MDFWKVLALKLSAKLTEKSIVEGKGDKVYFLVFAEAKSQNESSEGWRIIKNLCNMG